MAKENSTGKVYMSGFDKQGRPIMIMRPRLENTFDHDGNIKHLVYQVVCTYISRVGYGTWYGNWYGSR